MAKATTDSSRKASSKAGHVDPVVRKRELDKIAQRSLRERTKNRIKFLEDKVRSFEARDCDEHLASSMAMQEQLLNENTHLRASLMKIRLATDLVPSQATSKGGQKEETCSLAVPEPDSDSLSKGDMEGAEEQTTCLNGSICENEPQQHNMTETGVDVEISQQASNIRFMGDDISLCELPMTTRGLENSFYCNDSAIHVNNPEEEVPFMNLNLSALPDWTNFNSWQTPPATWSSRPSFSGGISISSSDSGIGMLVVPDEQKWSFCDGTFLRGLKMTKDNPDACRRRMDSVIAIRGILWGWETINQTTIKDPAWISLRDVDERVFGTWRRKAQKIAMMFVCSLVMAYRVDPTPENLERIPAFLRPRPSQECVEHPLVIDFLIWPGLRDFLVFNHQVYTQTGEFSERFVNDFNFNWPYLESWIFEFEADTNCLNFSKLFKQYVYDLKNWTMEPRFFDRYPELIHDIPCNSRGTYPAV